MADLGAAGRTSPGRGLRRPGRRWRRETVASAAALAALLNAACGSDEGSAGSTTTSADTTLATTTVTTALLPTTIPPTTAPATTVARTVPTTAARVPATTATTRAATTTLVPSTNGSATCTTDAAGQTVCAIPGRPLRRWWRRALLLPTAVGDGRTDEARAEYASVASFGELGLRLLAVGAPAGLVAACHEAALDEIRHAALCDEMAGRAPSSFGAIPGLVGRRLGGWRRSRRAQLRGLAVESFLDGWVNEGAAAAQLRQRAARATSSEDRDRLASMAADEQRHADLARSIITWCFDEEPVVVGRALARAAPVTSAA